MKLGVCLSMNPALPDKTGLESLAAAERAGFDYAEVPAAQLLALPASELDEAVERLQASALPVLSMNNLFQAEVRLTGPAVDDGRVDDYVTRALSLAGRLGAKTLVFGSTGARNVPFGFPREAAFGQLADMLSRFAPKAQAAGVEIAVEHVNHLEGNIVDYFTEALRLVDAVNHPAVVGFVDYYHLALGNEPLSLVADNASRIRHAHCANLLDRTIPTPTRHEDGLAAFLRLLKEKGYAHKLSVEGYSRDLAGDFAGAVEFIRGEFK